MKRFIFKALKQWKENGRRLPLMLRGARQVGKSYVVEAFAKSEFLDNYLVINFEQQPEFKSCFDTLDPRKIITKLELLADQSIDSNSTLLFLDEIQECPQAIMALRYFKEQLPGSFVIAAGSLLEFALEQENFRMPVGRVQFLYVKPLSFKEYLWNNSKKLYEFLSKVDLDTKFDAEIHQKLLGLLHEYAVLGGMPAVIDEYIQSRSFKKAQEIQAVLLTTYQNDFAKYANGSELRYLQMIYQKVPGLVSQQFKYAHISRDVQSRELKVPLQKLVKAGVIHTAYASQASGLPLNALINEKKFKLLFLDVGLVKRASYLDAELLLSQDILLVNKGALAEQLVGQELLAYQDWYSSSGLCFWARDKKNASAEVDYVIHIGNQIVPIEVKSGAGGRLKSLQVFLAEKKQSLGVKISSDVFKYEDGLLSLPLYLIGELERLVDLL